MGEGVQGFARAVLAGGCPCLLATKWDVAVVPSLWLMMEFYARMAADKVCNRLMWYSSVSGWEDE